MHKLIILVIVFFIILSNAQAQLHPEYGSFVGSLDLRMLGNGRDATLLAPFAYIDPNGKRWETPSGTTVNGASIPWPLWSLIGSPWTGKYREASVIHDYYCDKRIEPWNAVHKTFYTAMLANGVDALQAKIMYTAVYRFGPIWNFEYTPKCPNCLAVPYRVDVFMPKFNVDEFEALKRRVELSDPSLEQIENDADAAFRNEIMNLELGEPVFIQ